MGIYRIRTPTSKMYIADTPPHTNKKKGVVPTPSPGVFPHSSRLDQFPLRLENAAVTTEIKTGR